jgi:hypothetical protein
VQILAFCRHYGSFSSRRCDPADWNLELIEAMVDDMRAWWDDLSKGFESSVEYISDAITTEISKLASEVKGT